MLHIKWPFGVKTNITYDETTQEVSGYTFINGNYQRCATALAPLGMF